ncbi:hypothetical protein DAI22_04g023000 [Oryza sativa Japonica Group]|nr:hypothetical protein DAI22_04g023000 [Oryza sativa Japonica Group]
MAGDGWVMDIIWHTLLLGGDAMGGIWSSWSTEILLGLSFVAQLVLTVTAGFRWRGAGSRMRCVIWFSYVSADYVATTALGNLSISRTAGSRRLAAFWAPFFLLHLGGPDSVTAYELEDNQLSARHVLELILRVAGAVYIVYKSTSGSWALIPASWLMLFVGVAKYAEKTMALRRANLANVRRTVERERRLQRRRSRTTKANLSFAGDDDEGGLLMKAHTLFPICKNSMVDSSVETASNTDDAAIVHAKETLFREENYKNVFRVMEMELSLMYDFLYTKAAVIHTWHGYAIRAVSPVFTAVSLVLVELSNVAGHHRRSDVVITRVLLVATFLLETLSLLRALASFGVVVGFAMKFYAEAGGPGCVVASIGRLAGAKDHRRWCGKMGQLSVLQLIITGSASEQEDRSWDKECETYSKEKTIVVPQDVKELFFRRLLGQLIDLRKRMKADTGTETELRTMVANMRSKRGQLTLQNYDLWNQLRWSLGDELQLGILTWHIATDIYLSQSVKAIVAAVEDDAVLARWLMGIRTLSNYMMHLLAVRPDMLPGLVTRKLFELTCDDLARVWSKHQTSTSVGAAGGDDLESSSSSPRNICRLRDLWRVSPKTIEQQNKLAGMLIKQWEWDRKQESGAVELNKYLSRGIELAKKLLHLEVSRKDIDKVLQVILEVWVEMLFYAGYRCSKESHAKQLSQGGELTTIVWLMAEHVGLFLVNKTSKGAEEDYWNTRKRRYSRQPASQNV